MGFAIDDAKLATAFRHWSNLAAGMYFDAKDAAGLNAAMVQALRPAFEIVDSQGQVVTEGLVGGAALRVMPAPIRAAPEEPRRARAAVHGKAG